MTTGPEDETTLPDAAAVVRYLEAVAADRSHLAALDEALRRRLYVAAADVIHPDPTQRRALAKAFRRRDADEKRAREEAKLARTGIRSLRELPLFPTPAPLPRFEHGRSASLPDEAGSHDAEHPPTDDDRTLDEPRKCYVCKTPYHTLHTFYDQLCLRCGDFNFEKRAQTADLHGTTALLTGARVKIGYQAAIMLLRAGARVLLTTRFPHDASVRFAAEPDFSAFRDRLRIYGLDLRHTPSVERFAEHLIATEPRLDFVIHNACQTVRRPAGFYGHLMEGERAARAALTAGDASEAAGLVALRADERSVGLADAPELSQLALLAEDQLRGGGVFPEGALDQDRQQVDLRDHNSWRMRLSDVSTVELLEVQLVNAVAPFVLNARLRPLLARTPGRAKHVVNVSAVEGQFYREFKTDRHPHTNMAKAALNMMTRTSAIDFARDGIHMNSVDTGWVTDEDPAHLAQAKRAVHGFTPPLDIVDGAARILDPIFDGLRTGTHRFGLFLKDYKPVPW